MSGNIKLALLQMDVVGGDRAYNLTHARQLTAMAAGGETVK